MSYISEYYKLEKSLNESVYNNNLSVDILLEMLSIKLDADQYIPTSLIENVNVINLFDEYLPLIEAAELVNSDKDNSSDSDSNNSEGNTKKKKEFIAKYTNSVRKLIDWWYKIEPDKKFKTLHLILKIVVQLISAVASFVLISKVSKQVAGIDIVKSIPDKRIKFSHVDISIKNNIIYTIVSTAISVITGFIKGLSNKIEYAVNKKDLDKNISEMDKSIDKINDLLGKTDDVNEKKRLQKTKSDLSECLAKLIKLRDNNTKNEDT